MCLSLANDSSETVEVIIVNLGTVTASDMMMYHVLTTLLNLTFIQDLNHENNKCLILSEIIQAVPIRFAVKTQGLYYYCQSDGLDQGHKCVSNLTNF